MFICFLKIQVWMHLKCTTQQNRKGKLCFFKIRNWSTNLSILHILILLAEATSYMLDTFFPCGIYYLSMCVWKVTPWLNEIFYNIEELHVISLTCKCLIKICIKTDHKHFMKQNTVSITVRCLCLYGLNDRYFNLKNLGEVTGSSPHG
jgi:hypothetical protein